MACRQDSPIHLQRHQRLVAATNLQVRARESQSQEEFQSGKNCTTSPDRSSAAIRLCCDTRELVLKLEVLR